VDELGVRQADDRPAASHHGVIFTDSSSSSARRSSVTTTGAGLLRRPLSGSSVQRPASRASGKPRPSVRSRSSPPAPSLPPLFFIQQDAASDQVSPAPGGALGRADPRRLLRAHERVRDAGANPTRRRSPLYGRQKLINLPFFSLSLLLQQSGQTTEELLEHLNGFQKEAANKTVPCVSPRLHYGEETPVALTCFGVCVS
jgi:hypothetical protein